MKIIYLINKEKYLQYEFLLKGKLLMKSVLMVLL